MTIEERIERLERTNRRYRLMFTLIGVLAVCAVGISAAPDAGVPDVIQAKAFQVVDDEGNVLIVLRDDGGVGTLETFDRTGEMLVTLASTIADGKRAGVAATLYEGKVVVSLSVTLDGNGAVTTFNERGKRLVQLSSAVGKRCGVTTFNEKGKMLVNLGSTSEGNGSVTTFNDQETELVLISSTKVGGNLAVYNKTGEKVCILAVDEYGHGVIGVFDRNRKGRTLQPGP